MAKFRVKRMSDAEWLEFKPTFDLVYQMLGSTKDIALFCEKMTGSDETVVLISSYRAEVIEAVSPGGWYDSDQTSGHSWKLSGGHQDAHAAFDVQVSS